MIGTFLRQVICPPRKLAGEEESGLSFHQAKPGRASRGKRIAFRQWAGTAGAAAVCLFLVFPAAASQAMETEPTAMEDSRMVPETELSFMEVSSPAPEAGTAASDSLQVMTEPHTKEGGGKYRIGLVDYDEYLPSSRQFYYILAGLEENGWIGQGRIPFSLQEVEQGDLTIQQMFDSLVDADLGEYIEFPAGAFHYLAYEDEKEVEEDLKERAEGGLDLIITSGTSAGVFVKNLNLPVPMTDYSATDPVASGIIDSATQGSGNPNVWAQVEPSLPFRQLRYYHSVSPFKKLGIIVYGDETISGVPDIEASSEEIGFELVKYNIAECKRETEPEQEEYYGMLEKRIRQMAAEGIDAFFLTVDLINDTNRLLSLLTPFYEKNIPVYLMDDVSYVQKGALMLISANDMENVGRFVADTIARIFNGAQAGSLPCIYTSAPSIYVNYDIARRIHYPLTFEFLSVCDEIFTEEGGNES